MREYSVEFDNVAVTASQDLFALTPADDKPICIVGIDLAQSSDVGDAAEEILRWRIIRGHTTIGSGGTAPTPRPISSDDAAASFTSRVNDTTLASVGTPVNLHSSAFNIRTGLIFWPPPEVRYACSQLDGIIVVRLLSTPIDSLTMSGTIIVGEGTY